MLFLFLIYVFTSYMIHFFFLKDRPRLYKSKGKLTAYDRTNILIQRSCILNVKLKAKIVPILF